MNDSVLPSSPEAVVEEGRQTGYEVVGKRRQIGGAGAYVRHKFIYIQPFSFGTPSDAADEKCSTAMHV